MVSLSQVHAELRRVIGPDTVVVGHSLDSDMKALRLVHSRVIDTAALYPHPRGAPFKQSLKSLASKILGVSIQADAQKDSHCPVSSCGHDSIQDAAVALELALVYMRSCIREDTDAAASLGSQVRSSDAVSRAWACADAFVHPKEPLLLPIPSRIIPACGVDGSQKSVSPQSVFCAHLCGPYSHMPEHQQFLLGYRKESYVADVLRLGNTGADDTGSTDEVRVEVMIHSYENPYDATDAGRDFCETLDSSLSAPGVVWIDFNLTSPVVAGMDAMHLLDRTADGIFGRVPAGTLVAVVSQGDLVPLCAKLSKKRRCAWDGSRGRGGIEWTGDADEAELIVAAAHAMCGALFLRLRV